MNFATGVAARIQAGASWWAGDRNPKWLRYGAGGLVGLYAANRAINSFQRLRYGDILGAGVSAALAGAAGYAAYRYAFSQKAAENVLRDSQILSRWITGAAGRLSRRG